MITSQLNIPTFFLFFSSRDSLWLFTVLGQHLAGFWPQIWRLMAAACQLWPQTYKDFVRQKGWQDRCLLRVNTHKRPLHCFPQREVSLFHSIDSYIKILKCTKAHRKITLVGLRFIDWHLFLNEIKLLRLVYRRLLAKLISRWIKYHDKVYHNIRYTRTKQNKKTCKIWWGHLVTTCVLLGLVVLSSLKCCNSHADHETEPKTHRGAQEEEWVWSDWGGSISHQYAEAATTPPEPHSGGLCFLAAYHETHTGISIICLNRKCFCFFCSNKETWCFSNFFLRFAHWSITFIQAKQYIVSRSSFFGYNKYLYCNRVKSFCINI